MASFYSLEEAARVLGMSAEELKRKAQQREIRAFLDAGVDGFFTDNADLGVSARNSWLRKGRAAA